MLPQLCTTLTENILDDILLKNSNIVLSVFVNKHFKQTKPLTYFVCLKCLCCLREVTKTYLQLRDVLLRRKILLKGP